LYNAKVNQLTEQAMSGSYRQTAALGKFGELGAPALRDSVEKSEHP
jgi:hypothetical protein